MSKTGKMRKAVTEALMALAAEKDWDAISLHEIAAHANIPLSELRQKFASKRQILAAFIRQIDDQVLHKFDGSKADESPRERLFDVIMTRFEILAPYKKGLQNIYDHTRLSPSLSARLLADMLNSHYWMLAASGINAEGLHGFWRVPGIMGIYAAVFPIWLEDEDPGLAKTMAALDRRLARAERWAKRMNDLTDNISRFTCFFLPGRRCERKQTQASPTQTETNGATVEV